VSDSFSVGGHSSTNPSDRKKRFSMEAKANAIGSNAAANKVIRKIFIDLLPNVLRAACNGLHMAI